MDWYIYEADALINTITADEAFIAWYTARTGYRAERRADPGPVPPQSRTGETDAADAELAAAIKEGVNET